MGNNRFDINNLDKNIIEEKERTEDLLFDINKISTLNKERNILYKMIFNSLGDNVSIGSNFYCNFGKNINIGSNCNICANVSFSSYSNIDIKDNVYIGIGVVITTESIDINDRNIINSSDITIGKNTYIGEKSLILKGVKIGANCYIKPGSIVSFDLEDNTVFDGNDVVSKIDVKNEIKEDSSLINIYDLKNIMISKDLDNNLFLILKSSGEKRLLAYKDTYTDVKNIDEVVFVLSDIINVINGNINSNDINDYKDNIYQSSYYLGYLGVSKFNDEIYTVTTDDDDIIAVSINDFNVRFKRIFDYEISDEKIKNSFEK